MNNVTIGDNVRAERIRRYWRQRDLAERMRRSRSTISAVERGQRRITRDDLALLCAVFGIDQTKLTLDVCDEDLQDLGLAHGNSTDSSAIRFPSSALGLPVPALDDEHHPARAGTTTDTPDRG